MSFDRVVQTDVLVVGSGVSGLTAALAAAPAEVIVVTKGSLVSGSTPLAEGGIAAPVGPDDAPALHAADTVAVGAGLNDAAAVQVLTSEAVGAIGSLIASGARFDLGPDGALALGREAGHSLRRILHSGGDGTGAEVARALAEAVHSAGHVEVIEQAFVADLVVSGGRVVGATARLGDGARVLITAGAVLLATGGIGRVYANTTNPPESTGDGLAVAARAGAVIGDLEFVQFHPTALAVGKDPMPLLTEALRGEGSVLLDESGERFMLGEHRDAELAPRDVVARAVWRRVVGGERVVLDATRAVGEVFPDRFPTVFASCMIEGIDPRVAPMPVAPAAHYHMGGVVTDLHGRTSLPGLWAAGEVTRTGAHGANRLASNSLLEGLVFGARAGRSAAETSAPIAGPAYLGHAVDPGPAPDPCPDIETLVRDVMWHGVGVTRTGPGLREAIDELDRLDDKIPGRPSEIRSMVEVAAMIADAALARPERRGAHHREDAA